MAQPTTARTWRVSVTLDGRDLGVFDQRTGGKQTSGALTYLPGGMAPQIALPGGPPTIDVVTLQRLYDGDRDHPLAAFLFSAVETGKRATVKQRPLDANGNAYGGSIIWSGVLSGVQVPEPDSTSNNASMLLLEVTPDGPLVVSG